MADDLNQQTLDTISGPAAEALLAFLRRQERTGDADVGEFLKQSPEWASYEEVLRSHAEAANEVDLNAAVSSHAAPEADREDDSVSNQETVTFTGNANESFHEVPNGVAFETAVRELSVHAAGGLGVVCRGEDALLNREVAVKFIRPDQVTDAAETSFAREAEITGRLDHPGVTPVHGIGETHEGRRFYVMRFLPGKSLRKQIDSYYQREEQNESERAVDFRNMLASFVSVCKTIGYAHSRGILHRDIKPHNIMLGSYGETIVVDWGLAVPIQPSREQRAEGEQTMLLQGDGSVDEQPVIAGTLAYMAPEQAAGEPQLTAAADIYALGATLYHILSGRATLQGETFATAVQKIIRGDYPKPREVHKEVSQELEAICQKAMELKPARRYTTALELAADVERYLADEPVAAHPDNASQRIARWSRHHPVAVQVGTVSMLLVLVSVSASSIVSWNWYNEAVSSQLEAEDSKKEAVRLKEATLIQSAEMAADRWASDLSLRWLLLEYWADDPFLHQQLKRIAEVDDVQGDECAELENWLVSQCTNKLKGVSATSWYVNDLRGRLVARYDPNAPGRSVHHGKRYDFRDYYHGKGNDQPVRMPGEPPYPVLGKPHLSAIYRSEGENLAYRVALSVPVGPPEGRLGVLTMTIDLGYLKEADLIDMRENTFGGTVSLRGIYLNQKSQGNSKSLYRVADDLINTIDAKDYANVQQDRVLLIDNYSCPLKGNTGPRQAAMAPIIVNGVWTQLVVIVEEGDSMD